MVSFIADPRIAQSQAQRQAMLAEALTPYQLPRNPYGGSPVAGNLQKLAAALVARLAGEDANRLQKQQQAAQAAILSGIREAALPQSGPFYETIQTPVSGIAPGPGAVQTQIQRIADDGSVLPPEISAETARTAGIDPLTLKAVMDDAMRTGDVATQEAIKREAQKGFQQAYVDFRTAEGTSEKQAARNIMDQWNVLVDPSGAFATLQAREAVLEERSYKKGLTAEERLYQESLTDAQLKRHQKERLQDREWKLLDDTISRMHAAKIRLEEIIAEGIRAERDRDWAAVDAAERRELKLEDELAAEGRKFIDVYDKVEKRNVKIRASEYDKDPTRYDASQKYRGVNFRFTEDVTYRGKDYKAGDEAYINVRDPAFEEHENKGVVITKSTTEAGGNVSPLDQMRSGIDAVPDDASETAPSVTPDSVTRTEEESRILAQADQILERGSVTFVNQLERAGNWFSAYFVGGRDPFPAERKAIAQINALRNILLAPLVKAISVRGGRFAIENINPILPNSGAKPTDNLARIRQLIPRYERELELLNDAYYASKDGSVQQVNIGKTQGIIIDMLPLLKAIVRKSSLGPGSDDAISLSPGSSFSEEKAPEAPIGTVIEDAQGKWRKISNKGLTGEWEIIN
jgi:hypothetical protein